MLFRSVVFWLAYDGICRTLARRKNGDAIVGALVAVLVVAQPAPPAGAHDPGQGASFGSAVLSVDGDDPPAIGGCDEIVCEIPEGFGSLEEFEAIVTVPPGTPTIQVPNVPLPLLASPTVPQTAQAVTQRWHRVKAR